MKFSRYRVAGLLAAEIITLARFFCKAHRRAKESCVLYEGAANWISYGQKIRRGHKPNIVHRKLGKRSHFDTLFGT